MINYTVEHFDTINSTNTYLKEKAEGGAPSFSCAVADTQTDGRGRMGHSFYSPANSGLYMSLLLRPSTDLKGVKISNPALITACAAVAVSEAIKAVTDIDTDIKWVNDIYYNGKKVCGILAEGAYSVKLSSFEYIVLGIGLNISGNFDGTELKDIATSLYPSYSENELPSLKKRLMDKIIELLLERYFTQLHSGGMEFFDAYKNALFILGKDIEVLQGDSAKNATVLDLNSDFTLKVQYDDKSVANLNSGEVKLKLK